MRHVADRGLLSLLQYRRQKRGGTRVIEHNPVPALIQEFGKGRSDGRWCKTVGVSRKRGEQAKDSEPLWPRRLRESRAGQAKQTILDRTALASGADDRYGSPFGSRQSREHPRGIERIAAKKRRGDTAGDP